MVESNTLMVGLMKDEYSPKEKTNQVTVIAVTIHPKCDATYQVDIGALILKKTPKGRRLTWVNSPYIHELESQFNGVASASVIHGQCYVLRWIETILDVNSHKAWTIIESSVYYQMWNMCLKLVCPEKMPDGKQFYRPKNFQECLNYGVIGQRKCMTMIPEQLPLCKYTPGSPVFCDVEQFHGIVGILTNFTSDCSFTRFSNGVMASFSDALKMDLIERHIRIRSSRYFSRLRVILANESKVPVTVPPWVKTSTTSP
ncbi:hypothetical protein GE061_007971 [Apolygus lucorum]|uniref:Peptidase S1 domain-containing protein n=1 Tax=Apolygus lucorum TaxID=248454 RepID=A0A8S9WPS8_APOLU|nr:hypothetical protein GE061_007971 [Apolygus lucorum]